MAQAHCDPLFSTLLSLSLSSVLVSLYFDLASRISIYSGALDRLVSIVNTILWFKKGMVAIDRSIDILGVVTEPGW